MARSIVRNIFAGAILWVMLGAPGCAGPRAISPSLPTSAQTCPGLGATQGIAKYQGKIYLYGDAQTGVLREYRLLAGEEPQLNPTGRMARLTVGGRNLLNHPTGLALHEGLPCFLGNTVTATKQGRIYRLDLERAFADGTLDHAVLDDIQDDEAVQGSRPEYVRVGNRFLVATSDYGAGPNYVRFYDPKVLATASRTSDPGVLVRRVPCGPFVQMLHWVDETRTLVIVQNIVVGRRWRLTLVSDIGAPDYRSGKSVRVIDIAGHDNELEGYAQISDKLGVFITSSREHNVTFATVRSR